MQKLRGNDVMDKVLKVAKLNIKDMIRRMIMFYLVISVVLMFFANIGQYGDIFLPAVMDIMTFMFLIECASNTFKKKFYFTQSNNISRNTFVKGIVVSIVPISIIMAVVDFAINRAVNVFIKAPTVYDMIFTSGRNLSSVQERLNWIQDGSLGAIVGSILFSFALYCLAYAIGLIPGVISCRCSEKAQLGFSFMWVASIWIWLSIGNKFDILGKIKMLTWSGFSVAILYLVTISMLILGCFKLIKKAQCAK